MREAGLLLAGLGIGLLIALIYVLIWKAKVDLIVFDGLNAGKLERIVFVEVKTGGSQLTGRERQVRDMVFSRGVSWEEIRR